MLGNEDRMKISTKGRYAVRVMLDLALNNNGECIKVKEIFILSSFPSIFLLCFTFNISLLIPKQFKTAPIFLWFPQILPYFFFIFLFPIVHIGFVETTEKSGEHPPEFCSEKSPPIPRNALRIFALLYWHFTLLVRDNATIIIVVDELLDLIGLQGIYQCQ